MAKAAASKPSRKALKKCGRKMAARPQTQLWLVVVWADVEPSLLGPYPDEAARDRAARKYRKDEGDEHGIYPLDIRGTGKPAIDSYSGGFFDG